MSLSFSIRLFHCSRRVRIKPLRTEEMNDLEEVVAFIRDTVKRRIRASSHWKKSQPRKEMESYLTHKEQLISPHDQAFIFVSWNFKKTEKVNKGEYRYWAKKKFFACIISREYLKWERVGWGGGGYPPISHQVTDTINTSKFRYWQLFSFFPLANPWIFHVHT